MQKNKFLTFLFSIIPGVGHMYLGYMKRGAEFMAMFAASMYLAIMFTFWLNLPIIGAIFMIVLPIIWFYQMFDSMHAISQMRRLGIEVPQDDGFFVPGFANITNSNALNVFKNRKAVKTVAAILVCVGLYVLITNILNGINNIMQNNIWDYYNSVYYRTYQSIMNYVPSVIISLVLIFGGIKLLFGKNNNQNNQDGGE